MKKLLLLSASIVACGFCIKAAAQSNTAIEFSSKAPDKLFIGALLSAKSLNKDQHEFIDVPLNDITVSFSVPVKSIDINPSLPNMKKALENAIQTKPPSQNLSFSYSIWELSSYNQLPLLFGQQINLPELTGIKSIRKTKKTLVCMDISRIAVSIEMDLPEALIAKPLPDQYDKNDVIYVSSVKFGRRAIVLIESRADYGDIKSALETMLANKPADEKSMRVLSNANIRTITQGIENFEVTDENPFNKIINDINKQITIADFGVPINFTAAYLKNHEAFVNKF